MSVLFAAALAASQAAAPAPCGGAAAFAFPEPCAETKPWGVCHLLGSAADRDGLEAEFDRWADAGLGGIRFVPIYGVRGREEGRKAFMSPEYLEMMADANRIAAEHGMKVDASFGPGWCFGGAWIPPELGVQGLKVVADGEEPPPRSRVLWSGGGRSLVSYFTGQKVKRAQEVDSGPMLNPFSPAALAAHVARAGAFGDRADALPRGSFHDSFEYFDAGWSDEFPALFEKYRGYRIEDHFAELAGIGDSGTVARVKFDYRETLGDIIVRETFPAWTEWCRRRGVVSHNQAHGAPANLLEFYALADVPETEMFGRGGRDRFRSGFGPGFRSGDRSVAMAKFASSAARLAGRRHASAEAFTWMAEHFCETLEEAKAMGDLFFIAGIDRLYFHSVVYSPPDALWPGWCFYAASELNPRNPVWRHAKPLFGYFARVQSLLAEAKSGNDVLLYWPLDDQWMDADGLSSMLTVHAHWMEDLPFGKLAARLAAGGWQFDYVSDAFLSGALPPGCRAIVVPETRYMKQATLDRLSEIAKRIPVLFEKSLPQSSPGLRGGPLDLFAAPRPVEDAAKALLATDARREPFAAEETPFDAIRLEWNGGKLFFAVNSSMSPAALSVPPGGRVMDPLSGRVSEGAEKIVLHPAESRFVWSPGPSPRALPAEAAVAAPEGGAVALGSGWRLEFMSDVSGRPLPPPREGADALGDWTRLGPAEEAFSGAAVYGVAFDMPEGSAKRRWRLDLGEVFNSARVSVNGVDSGVAFMHPYSLELPPGALKDGENVLSVEVANLGANRIRAYDREGVEWKVFEDANVVQYDYSPMDASKWPVLPSGLAGPVRLVPCGGD